MAQENEYSIEERIIFALQWLGFEDVDIHRRFNPEYFQKEEDSIESEITYSCTDGLVIEPIASNIVKMLEGMLDFHNKADTIKEKIDEAFKQKGFDNEIDETETNT